MGVDRVDDIEDDSQLRRGQPGQLALDCRIIPFLMFPFIAVAHKIYGIPQTINTATYVFFLAYEKLFALRKHAPGPPAKEVEAMVTGM